MSNALVTVHTDLVTQLPSIDGIRLLLLPGDVAIDCQYLTPSLHIVAPDIVDHELPFRLGLQCLAVIDLRLNMPDDTWDDVCAQLPGGFAWYSPYTTKHAESCGITVPPPRVRLAEALRTLEQGGYQRGPGCPVQSAAIDQTTAEPSSW